MTATKSAIEMTDQEIHDILDAQNLLDVPEFDEANIETILVERTRKCLNALGLTEYQVRTSGSFTKFGVCHYAWKYKVAKIVLTDLTFLQAKIEKSFKEAIDTILHEIAHACRPKDAHRAPWKSLAIALGLSGKIAGNLSDEVRNAIPYKYFIVVKKSGRIKGTMVKSKTVKTWESYTEGGNEDQLLIDVIVNHGQGYAKVKEQAEQIHQNYIDSLTKTREEEECLA